MPLSSKRIVSIDAIPTDESVTKKFWETAFFKALLQFCTTKQLFKFSKQYLKQFSVFDVSYSIQNALMLPRRHQTNFKAGW